MKLRPSRFFIHCLAKQDNILMSYHLCLDALDMAISLMKTGQIKRIIVCNCISNSLQKRIDQLIHKHQIKQPSVYYPGRLDTYQNHGTKKSDYEEIVYDWGALPTYYLSKAAKQMALI